MVMLSSSLSSGMWSGCGSVSTTKLIRVPGAAKLRSPSISSLSSLTGQPTTSSCLPSTSSVLICATRWIARPLACVCDHQPLGVSPSTPTPAPTTTISLSPTLTSSASSGLIRVRDCPGAGHADMYPMTAQSRQRRRSWPYVAPLMVTLRYEKEYSLPCRSVFFSTVRTPGCSAVCAMSRSTTFVPLMRTTCVRVCAPSAKSSCCTASNCWCWIGMSVGTCTTRF
mmetsp:Transcript_28823/g.85338  ORF Transcript_28823/g.85338 Transcript_28823/m.85338 type:complete len:225 (-) Transcript_28823:3309-3983(-)